MEIGDIFFIAHPSVEINVFELGLYFTISRGVII